MLTTRTFPTNLTLPPKLPFGLWCYRWLSYLQWSQSMAPSYKIYYAVYSFSRWTSTEFYHLLHLDPIAHISTSKFIQDPWYSKGLDIKQFATMILPQQHNLQNYTIDKLCHGEDYNRYLNMFDFIVVSLVHLSRSNLQHQFPQGRGSFLVIQQSWSLLRKEGSREDVWAQ